MKVFAALLAVLAAASVAVEASHVDLSARSHHNNLALRAPATNSGRKSCKNHKVSNGGSSSTASQGSTSTPAPQNKPQNNNGGNGGNGGGGGVINVHSNCGPTGATSQVTKTSGPNGNIDWLNCGINNGGWRPPTLHVNDVKVKSLSSAINDPGSPFKACSQYVPLFNRYAAQFGVPPIFLASFALQESSCNPQTVGGGGEQGLMQITKDKCGGAPGGNCRDPDFNIRTGARFFADTLRGNGGDVLKSIGQYNGWFPGMTFGQATAARNSGCCRCQNNLDYLHQFLNGWCQNVNAYNSNFRLGKYFNLDVCN